MVVVTGCFSFASRPLLPENKAPVIDAGYPDSGQTISIGSNGTTVWIKAYDPEGAELDYSWSCGEHIECGTAALVKRGSSVTIPWEPALDGQVLEVTVEDDEHKIASRRWPIVVPAQ